jgi:hypothetical protein
MLDRYLDWITSLEPNWVGVVLFVVPALISLLILSLFLALAVTSNPVITLTTIALLVISITLYALYLAIFKQGVNK